MKRLIFLLFLASCSPLKEIQTQYQQENYRTTINKSQDILRSDSLNASVYNLMGKAYLNLGKMDSALYALKRAFTLSPEDTVFKDDLLKARIQKGDTLLKKGHYEQALQQFKLGLDLTRNSSILYERLGDSYLALEDLGNAEKYYKNSAKIKNRSGLTRKLARLDSLQTTAQNKLEKGLSAFKEENYKKAADLYASALKINPGLKPARYHLRLSKGMIFYEKGGKMDQWDAIEQFGLASTLCPKSSEPHYYMGLAYYKKNKKDYNAYEDAISEFRCAIELEPNSIIADKARKKIESLKAYQKKMRDFWGK